MDSLAIVTALYEHLILYIASWTRHAALIPGHQFCFLKLPRRVLEKGDQNQLDRKEGELRCTDETRYKPKPDGINKQEENFTVRTHLKAQRLHKEYFSRRDHGKKRRERSRMTVLGK